MNLKGLRNYSIKFCKYLPVPCSIPGTVPGTRDTRMNKTVPALWRYQGVWANQPVSGHLKNAINRESDLSVPRMPWGLGEHPGKVSSGSSNWTDLGRIFAEPQILQGFPVSALALSLWLSLEGMSFFFPEEKIMLTNKLGGLLRAEEEGQTLLANACPFILYIRIGFG